MNGITESKKSRTLLMLPLIVSQLFFTFTLILYTFGPWQWPTRVPNLFYPLVIVFQLSFAFGYLHSLRKLPTLKSLTLSNKYKEYLYIAIIINFLYVLLNYFNTVGISIFSINTMFETISNGLVNPSDQYQQKFQMEKSLIPYFSYLSVLTAPLLWPIIPISILYYEKLKFSFKMILILTILVEISRWLSIGTSKGVIDLLLIICTTIFLKQLLKYFSENQENNEKKVNKTKLVIILSLLTVAGFFTFSNNVSDRVNDNWIDYSISNGFVELDFDAPLMRIVPENLEPTVIYLTSYLTQGYYAFSLSLEIPFRPMYGIGNSMFLIENFSNIFNENFYEISYQFRMSEYYWHPYSNWHSFYVWVANDVHYLGVVFVMYILGYLFSSSLKSFLYEKNKISLVLFLLITLMVIYIPANNQVLSYPTTFMVFWTSLLYWLITRRYKIVIKN